MDVRRNIPPTSEATKVESPTSNHNKTAPATPAAKALSIMGKVHGSLARAGKVKSQTPKVCHIHDVSGKLRVDD